MWVLWGNIVNLDLCLSFGKGFITPKFQSFKQDEAGADVDADTDGSGNGSGKKVENGKEKKKKLCNSSL